MSAPQTVEAVRLSLDLHEMRARNASTNIANAGKPGAAARQLDFAAVESALRNAAASTDASEAGRWLAAAREALDGVSPTSDGTGVQLDHEVADMADAGLAYQALTEALGRQFGLMRIAIAGRT
jgi:flagellar basal-body rod protein FlgB